MPSAQPIRHSTTMAPIPRPPLAGGGPKPPPPKPPPDSPRRSSILSLCSDSSKRIIALHRRDFSAPRLVLTPARQILPGVKSSTRHSTNLAHAEPLNQPHMVTRKLPRQYDLIEVEPIFTLNHKPIFTLSRHDPDLSDVRSRVADRVARVRVLNHGYAAQRGVQPGAPLDSRDRAIVPPGFADFSRRLCRRACKAAGRFGRSRVRRPAL